MKKIISTSTIFTFFLFFISSCVKNRDFINDSNSVDISGKKLIHYWNFNDTSTLDNLIKPTFTIDSINTKLSFDFLSSGGVDGYFDFLNPSTNTLNIRNNDQPGALLRVRNPSLDMVISAPTKHYKNIVLQYAVAISSSTSGALNDSVYYSLDGINYTNAGLSTPNYTPTVDPSFTLISYDLSNIPSVNDNPNFKFKIVFTNGNTNTRGNTRFDNITVDADSISTSSNTNHFPIATEDNFITSMDSTITGNVSLNDVPSLDGGNQWNVITNTVNGTLSFASNGSFTYTPNAHFTGVDSFSYKIVDVDGDADTAVTKITTNALPLILMHYWNFNEAGSGLPSMIIPNVSTDQLNTRLDFQFGTSGTTTGYYDTISSTTNINLVNGNTAGYSLRVRNPSNEMVISAPTNNFKNILLKYAVAISSAKYAPRTQSYSYSTDNGVTWITNGLTTLVDTFAIDANDSIRYVDPNYALRTFDFSGIPSVNNNSGFKFKITFGTSNTPASPTKGNTRFDNLTIEGNRQ